MCKDCYSPYDLYVRHSDITPFGETVSGPASPATTQLPYDPTVPSYGAPGVIGRAIQRALHRSKDIADVQAAEKPGVNGMYNSVTYDVGSVQLFMRPAIQSGQNSKVRSGISPTTLDALTM
jgi:hypothetical protein